MIPTLQAEFEHLAGELIELIAPDRCGACGRVVDRGVVAGWCDPCLEQLALLESDRCGACGDVLGPGGKCPRCRADGRPWEGMWAVAEHSGVLHDMLGRWKYGPDPVLSRPLGALLATAAAGVVAVEPGTRVVPVPQHPDAWRRRGFHPAGDLANAVVASLGGRRRTPLRRARRSPPQVGLTAAERRRNVVRLFGVPARAERCLAGRPVLLVDDVVTTTATAAACATALRAAGASPIMVLALARATV